MLDAMTPPADSQLTRATPVIEPIDRFIYNNAPMLVYWEATRACALACVHCRAEAVPNRHPMELGTDEAKVLLEQVASFPEREFGWGNGLPHVVITGGDPLQRPDVFDLITFGTELGLRMSITPAGTERLTPAMIDRLLDAGIDSLGLSLDGSTPQKHDTLRGVEGSYEWTMTAMRAAAARGIPMQINTMVTAQTLDDLPAIYDVLKDVGIARWALFFLISTGRGRELADITPVQSERLLQSLLELQRESPFPIKTTEAHHYRRIAYKRLRRRGIDDAALLKMPIGRGFGIRDGNGIVFVSHIGQVYPSGFLPMSAGNVRARGLVDIYQNSELFRTVRNPNSLQGKCGRCEFRAICGGSRARAYAMEGDPRASDPLCLYQPEPAHYQRR